MNLKTGLIGTGAAIFIFFVILILLENRSALTAMNARLDTIDAQVSQLEARRPTGDMRRRSRTATRYTSPKQRTITPDSRTAASSGESVPKLREKVEERQVRIDQEREPETDRGTKIDLDEETAEERAERRQRNSIPRDLREESIRRFSEAVQQDRERFGAEETREIERLYGDSVREAGSEESLSALNELIEEYPDANRTGCAALRMAGEMLRQNDDEQASALLNHIIENKSDAVFRNGVAVQPEALLMASGIAARNGDNELARMHLQNVIENFDSETDARDRPFGRIAQARLAELGE